VLLHGYGTSSFLWRWVAPLLVEAGHTAYAVDLFGYGESDRPFDADFGIAAQAEYLDRALTSLRIASATVVGVDVGALVALRLAAARPERVGRIVLVNPPALDDLPGDDVRLVQRGTARFAFRVSRGVMGVAPLLTPLLEGGVADASRMPPRLVARYLAPYVGRDGVSHLLALARSLRDEDVEEITLDAVRVPALVVRGSEDRWVDERASDALARELPGARLERLEGVGRLAPEEAPEALAGLVTGFMTATGSGVATAPGRGEQVVR
jgi:pimeloyl-ACP methyl ester carboxylesterase